MTINEMAELYIRENCLTLESVKQFYKEVSKVLEEIPRKTIIRYFKEGKESVVFDCKEAKLFFQNSRSKGEFDKSEIHIEAEKILGISGMQYIESAKIDFCIDEVSFMVDRTALDDASDKFKQMYLEELRQWDKTATGEEEFFFISREELE